MASSSALCRGIYRHFRKMLKRLCNFDDNRSSAQGRGLFVVAEVGCGWSCGSRHGPQLPRQATGRGSGLRPTSSRSLPRSAIAWRVDWAADRHARKQSKAYLEDSTAWPSCITRPATAWASKFATFYKRLTAAGKKPMLALAAVMRKAQRRKNSTELMTGVGSPTVCQPYHLMARRGPVFSNRSMRKAKQLL